MANGVEESGRIAWEIALLTAAESAAEIAAETAVETAVATAVANAVVNVVANVVATALVIALATASVTSAQHAGRPVVHLNLVHNLSCCPSGSRFVVVASRPFFVTPCFGPWPPVGLRACRSAPDFVQAILGKCEKTAVLAPTRTFASQSLIQLYMLRFATGWKTAYTHCFIKKRPRFDKLITQAVLAAFQYGKHCFDGLGGRGRTASDNPLSIGMHGGGNKHDSPHRPLPAELWPRS